MTPPEFHKIDPVDMTPAQNRTYKNMREAALEIKPLAYYPDGSILIELISRYGGGRHKRRLTAHGISMEA